MNKIKLVLFFRLLKNYSSIDTEKKNITECIPISYGLYNQGSDKQETSIFRNFKKLRIFFIFNEKRRVLF